MARHAAKESSMRLLRLLLVLSWPLLIASRCLSAQSSETPDSSQNLMNAGYPILPPIIRTPIVSLSDANNSGQNQDQDGQVYWSVRPTQLPPFLYASETRSSNGTAPVATGIFNSGVTGILSSDSLPENRPKISLGEYAAYWRTHKVHASRVYTNADVENLKTVRP
jgi:hypothetical protein